MELLRQVQRRVGRVEVLVAPTAVREPGDGEVAEDRLKGPRMSGFDGSSRGALCVCHRREALLAQSTQVQVVLEELAAQPTEIDREPRLELGVGEALRFLAFHERAHLLEAGAARAEGVVGALRHGNLLLGESYSMNAVGSRVVDARRTWLKEKKR